MKMKEHKQFFRTKKKKTEIKVEVGEKTTTNKALTCVLVAAPEFPEKEKVQKFTELVT